MGRADFGGPGRGRGFTPAAGGPVPYEITEAPLSTIVSGRR